MTLRSNAREGARRAAHLRRLNLERVLAVAMDHPRPFTRAELIDATGLSAPTIGTLVSSLINSGLLNDLGTGPSRGGRRPAFMEFNSRYRVVGGIHLGRSRTRLAVADLRGDVIARRVVPTPQDGEPALQLATVGHALFELMSDHALGPERLIAVGVGTHGVVDTLEGRVLPLAPGSPPLPIKALLQAVLDAPVVVENDVNLAILGERWRGAARGHETCAFLTFGRGIGAGVVVNGRLHHGHHFLAGEIGLMCVGAEHLPEAPRAFGCLETLAGLGAVARRWGGADTNGHWIAGMVQAARTGDPRARQLVDEVVRLIGMAVANVSVVLDPSLIVLGGTLMLEGRDLVPAVCEVVGRIVPMPAQIVVSELKDEAPLWGSLLVAITDAREVLRSALAEGDA